MKRLPPSTLVEAWHAPTGDHDLPCIWPIGSGRLDRVLEKVRKLPQREQIDIYITLAGQRSIHAVEWPYIPLDDIEIAMD